MLWIEIILGLIIVLLLLWIYYSGGGTLKTKRLTDRIKELREENEALKETNEALRSGLSSSSERYSRPIALAGGLIEELMRVKEAIRGSNSAKKTLAEKYDEEISPQLIQNILASKKNISSPLKRRLTHEILVANIGRDILKGLDQGKSLEDSVAEAGVPLRIGKEHVKLLKETGYLDNKLNLTDWGTEAIEL